VLRVLRQLGRIHALLAGIENAMHASTTQGRRHRHMFLSDSSDSYNNQLMDWSIDSIQIFI